ITAASTLHAKLSAFTRQPLPFGPSPVEEMARLRDALGGGPRLLVKRDDAITFGFGGNKVRKLEYVLAQALDAGADTLVTMGGVQSNHARATAAAAAKLGLACVLIANGEPPDRPTGNALLATLLGAEIVYVATRAERQAALDGAVVRLHAEGRRPYAIPLGASTPAGALGFVRAIGEIVGQGVVPDAIVHASSSGGTQAGLLAGCALHGLHTRVIGISADDPAADIGAGVRTILEGMGTLLEMDGAAFADACTIDVDDSFVGAGYGIPTDASREAQRLAARTEALFVDHTYTAKGLAGLIAGVRSRRLDDHATVMFWHTGGQPGLFA
ncbi:MAG: 1-aminocyclopropane-1-carboxylate deaminase/D-cysteine desulfhydrase, partial [Longimicrobiales bacterium]